MCSCCARFTLIAKSRHSTRRSFVCGGTTVAFVVKMRKEMHSRRRLRHHPRGVLAALRPSQQIDFLHCRTVASGEFPQLVISGKHLSFVYLSKGSGTVCGVSSSLKRLEEFRKRYQSLSKRTFFTELSRARFHRGLCRCCVSAMGGTLRIIADPLQSLH